MGRPDVFTYVVPRHCQLAPCEATAGVFIHSLTNIGPDWKEALISYRLHRRLYIFLFHFDCMEANVLPALRLVNMQ
jgi:hypothetical protein